MQALTDVPHTTTHRAAPNHGHDAVSAGRKQPLMSPLMCSLRLHETNMSQLGICGSCLQELFSHGVTIATNS